MKHPNITQLKALLPSKEAISGFIAGVVLAVGLAASYNVKAKPMLKPQYRIALKTYDCDNRRQIPIDWYVNSDLAPALQRLNDLCHQEKAALALAQVWEKIQWQEWFTMNDSQLTLKHKFINALHVAQKVQS